MEDSTTGDRATSVVFQRDESAFVDAQSDEGVTVANRFVTAYGVESVAHEVVEGRLQVSRGRSTAFKFEDDLII